MPAIVFIFIGASEARPHTRTSAQLCWYFYFFSVLSPIIAWMRSTAKKNRNYGDHTNRIGQRPRMQRITTRIYIHNSYLYDFAIPLCDLCRLGWPTIQYQFHDVKINRWNLLRLTRSLLWARSLCMNNKKCIRQNWNDIINSMNFGWKKRMRSAWADIHLRYSLLHFQWFFCCIFRLMVTVYWCYCCRRHCWHSRVCYCRTMHYKWTLCLYLSINFVCFSLILYNAIIVLFITINLCSVACALFSAEQVDGTGQSGRRTMAFITVAFIVQCLKSTR